MKAKDKAHEIYTSCWNLIEKYKTRDPVLHHRLLAKHFSLMIIDRLLEEAQYNQDFYKKVKQILEEEYVYRP